MPGRAILASRVTDDSLDGLVRQAVWMAAMRVAAGRDRPLGVGPSLLGSVDADRRKRPLVRRRNCRDLHREDHVLVGHEVLVLLEERHVVSSVAREQGCDAPETVGLHDGDECPHRLAFEAGSDDASQKDVVMLPTAFPFGRLNASVSSSERVREIRAVIRQSPAAPTSSRQSVERRSA
jgi:hypothetical protein